MNYNYVEEISELKKKVNRIETGWTYVEGLLFTLVDHLGLKFEETHSNHRVVKKEK